MKVNQKKIFIILVSALSTAGCLPVAKKFAIEFKDPSAFTNLKLNVSSVQVQNNQLIVHGSGLIDIKTIKLVNNGVTENLVVESATSGQLVANGLSAVAIGVGKVFDMVLSDAYGSATVPVTFTLENGSITAAQLSDMGAAPGQILKYDGTKWEPSTLSSSQVYQGVWNANTNIPNLNLTSPVSGEYYIVSAAGTFNTIAYDIGDWIIHNGTGWDKVVSSAANKLSLSGGTLTGNLQLDTLLKFKGASNYVTLKASPTLATDIILTLPKTLGTSGQFLTTDGTGVMSWTTPTDPVIDNLDATQIADGSVTSTAFQYLAGATSNIQAQLNAKQATGNFVTALTGDVTASGAGSVAATVATVGGATAVNIAAATALANAATNANTASAIIKRDASGNFSAGTITGTFNGNATNVTGTVAVANGGTGNTTLGVNQLLFGNGTSAVSGLPTTAIPAVLLSTVASGAPTWTTSTTGNVLKGSVSGVSFGALDSSDLPAGTLSGSGTANYIPYYSTTKTLANSPMAISGNNVGIGTATPTEKLIVSGDGVIGGSNAKTDLYPNFLSVQTPAVLEINKGTAVAAGSFNYPVLSLVNNQSGTNNIIGSVAFSNLNSGTADKRIGQMYVYTDGAVNSGAYAFSTANLGTVAERMRISSIGNVGIGTTTPSDKLDVYNGAIRSSRNNVQYIYLSGGDATNQHTYLRSISTEGNKKIMYLQAFNDASGTPAGTNGFQFQTGTAATPANVMTILEAGNVGIGTSTPTSALEVNAPGAAFGVNQLKITDGTTGGYFSVSEGASGAANYLPTFSFASTGVNGSGGALLGMIPTANDVLTGGAAIILDGRASTGTALTNANILNVRNNGTALMTVTAGGSVGIGTTGPNQLLEVVKSQAAATYVRVGNSNASGVAGIVANSNLGNVSYQSIGSTEGSTGWAGYGRMRTDSALNGLIFSTGGAKPLLFLTNDVEKLRIESSGNVGIGTTAPNAKLVVSDGSTPQASVAAVTPLISVQASGPAYIMGKDLTNGIEYMFGTSTLGVAWTGSTSNHNFQLRTNNNPRLTIDTAGNVGIGTTAPSTFLHVKTATAGATMATFESGTGSCTVIPNSGMSCSSDIRLKENVEEIINGLDKVLNLRGVTFQWKERSSADDSRHMGFIAQEVEKVAPELVSKDTRGYKQVNYANFVAVLTEAVKDLFHKWSNDSQGLHREIASVKAESAQLKKDNELLKLENKSIKSYLCRKDPNAEICK